MAKKIRSLSDEFASELIGHTVDLMRYTETVRRRIIARLWLLRDELTEKVQSLDGTANSREKRAKLLRLIERAEATIRTGYKEMRDVHLNEMTSLAQMENDYAPKMYNEILKVNLAESVFTSEELRVIARKTLIRGAPSEDWWARQALATQHKFEDQIRLGYMQDETIQALVQRIRGKATGKRLAAKVNGKIVSVSEFKGGVMDVSTRNAEALVRTSVQAVSNNILLETYEGNDDVTKGLQAIATLDLRTTDICKTRDHHAWYIDSHEPIAPTKEPWPGPAPWHWSCRSILIPITYSWEELAQRAQAKKSARALARKADKALDEGTRASMDGQVSKVLEYEEWLKQQSKERQIDALGPGKYELWVNNKLTFEQMVDQRGNPLTIEEIRKRNGI